MDSWTTLPWKMSSFLLAHSTLHTLYYSETLSNKTSLLLQMALWTCWFDPFPTQHITILSQRHLQWAPKIETSKGWRTWVTEACRQRLGFQSWDSSGESWCLSLYEYRWITLWWVTEFLRAAARSRDAFRKTGIEPLNALAIDRRAVLPMEHLQQAGFAQGPSAAWVFDRLLK